LLYKNTEIYVSMRVPRVYQRAMMLLLFYPRNSRHIGEVHKYIYV